MSYVLNTYARSVKENFIKGEGVYLYTDKGDRYLDFCSGISCTNLGYQHKHLAKTMKEMADRPWHLSNLFSIKEQEKFAERICKFTKFDAVGLQNSGTEAVELAIKAAVKYFHSIGKPEKNRLLVCSPGFHGRTIAAMSAGNNPKHTKGFPILNIFDHFEFGNHEQFKEKITDKTCAILIEAIQGEQGLSVMSDNSLKELRDLCDEKGILLICDEVQSGYYRTGKFFAYQHANIKKPDIVTFAKSCANGIACGGTLMVKKVASAFEIGSHGSTFAGGPLAMSMANAVLDVMLEDGFAKHVQEVSKYFHEKLNNIKNKFPNIIKEIRGKGLMVGICMVDEPSKFMEQLLKNKLITVKSASNVIRLYPPLIIKKEDITTGIKILEKTCKEYKS